MQEQIFTIQQVAEELNLSPTSLRNWEKELEGIIKIERTAPRRENQEGDRYYTRHDIDAFKLVQKLRDDGFNFKAIRTMFEHMQNTSGSLPAIVQDVALVSESSSSTPSRLPDEQVMDIARAVASVLMPAINEIAIGRETLALGEGERQDRFLAEARNVIEESARQSKEKIEQMREVSQTLLNSSRDEQEVFLKRLEELIEADSRKREEQVEAAIKKMTDIRETMTREVEQILSDDKKKTGFFSKLFNR
ncbi:MerR family transcriptional regulator [Alicyclobacillus fodiniaquatilis]|uniref:MerR family transcriptional regulator n=1 Tax=Alicyclobacillus fodiniaquatilis TaxID=1661150 RepID=A0ABW4JFZ9_9BACL